MLRLHEIFVEVNEKFENIFGRPNFARLHKNSKGMLLKKCMVQLLNRAISDIFQEIF